MRREWRKEQWWLEEGVNTEMKTKKLLKTAVGNAFARNKLACLSTALMYVNESPPSRTFAFLQAPFLLALLHHQPPVLVLVIFLVLFQLLWQHFGSQPNNEAFVCHNAFASLFFLCFFLEENTHMPHTWGIVCIEPKEAKEDDSQKSGDFRLSGRFHLRFKSKNNSRLDYIHAALWQPESGGTVVLEWRFPKYFFK